MYDLETYYLAVPRDYRPTKMTGHKFGKNNKFRPNKSDHISAIGILENGRLVLYHNIFAANPLPKELFFNLPMIDQYTLETEGATNDFCDWKKINS